MNAFLFGILPVVVLATVDLGIRHKYAEHWSSGQWTVYAASIVYVLTAGFAFWTVIKPWVGRRWRLWAVSAALGLFSAVVYISQYAYYNYFGVLPNVATYKYAIENTAVSMANTGDGASPAVLGGLLAGTAVFFGMWLAGFHAWKDGAPRWRRAASATGRLPWRSALVVAAMTPVLYHNVGMEQGTAMPSVHAVLSVAKAAEYTLITKDEYRKYLQVGNRLPLAKVERPAPLNVVYIINESVRADKLSYYGSKRDTTPQVKAFLDAHAEQVFLFERFYTNSTTSRESYPSMITGVHPNESFTKLHTLPLVYEYAKMFPDMYTFLGSSHRYRNNNFRLFIKSPSLDSEFYREVANLPVANNQGIDDKYLVEEFRSQMERVPSGSRFTAVLHMNTTHFPYNAPAEFRVFPGSSHLDNYENALYYLDILHGKVLGILESRKLLENTVIVFASDHGEAFGEHGAFGHQRLFHEEGIHVPFWIYLPHELAGRHRARLDIARRVEHSNLDIVPTLVDLLGLSGEPDVVNARSQLLGQSLIAPEAEQGQPILVYNGYTATSLRRGFALVDGPYRMLVHAERAADGDYRFEAYDVRQDPLQKKNLWRSTPESLKQRWLASLEPYPNVHEDFLAVMHGEDEPHSGAQGRLSAQ